MLGDLGPQSLANMYTNARDGSQVVSYGVGWVAEIDEVTRIWQEPAGSPGGLAPGPYAFGKEQPVISTLPAELQQVLDRWVAAELAGDAATLGAVLHPQFLFAGPFGYLLDREQWLARFTAGDRYHTVFTSFDFTVDIPVRIIRDTALVIGTQEQTGTHQGEPVDGQLRSTVVLIRDPSWLITGMHLSLRRPP